MTAQSQIRTQTQPSGCRSLAEDIAPLSYLVADLAAFVDGIDVNAQTNLVQMQTLRGATCRFSEAIAGLRDGFSVLDQTAQETETAAAARLESISENSARYQMLSEWGAGIGPRTEELERVLKEIVGSNAEIARIARQVNILAVNASIEAARAGDAGRGFAVVAEAVNELSRKTASAASGIQTAISSLNTWTTGMRDDSRRLAPEFQRGRETAQITSDAVSIIAEEMATARTRIDAMNTAVTMLAEAESDVGNVCNAIEMGAQQTAHGVAEARNRAGYMRDRCEILLQRSAEVESDSPDAPLIAHAQQVAGEVAAAFEAGLASGAISRDELFDTRHRPIPDTNPEQLMARHTKFTDRVVPPIIERALAFDDRILFLCPCDRTGYIATHNRKFSKPQGLDPEVNAAQSRNRRLFSDRTGAQAGASRSPFLLQVYRRDMGAQGIIMMKDISAPITVQGRHWGGLRVGSRCDTST